MKARTAAEEASARHLQHRVTGVECGGGEGGCSLRAEFSLAACDG
jgi:hypothetical protein